MPANEPNDLRELGKRLDEIHRRDEERSKPPTQTPANMAFRFATEMVAACAVGAAMGWGLDWLFGTSPIFLIVVFIFGAGAGLMNISRASKELNKEQ